MNKFNSTSDRVGLLHFARGAQVDTPIKPVDRGFDRVATATAIDKLSFVGGTNSAEGMWQARDQLNSIGQSNRSSLRVIVFFSDGAASAFSSYFFPTSGNCPFPGSLTTPGDNPNGGNALLGLYRIDQASADLSSGTNCDATGLKNVELTPWYNAHNTLARANDASLREFPIVTNSPRVVTKDLSTSSRAWININRASRNLAESMAAKARQEGIVVFTLGMGAALASQEGPDPETGEDLLRCMANTSDAIARCRKPKEPIGQYCYAATESDLSPCFTRLASAILRISK